MKAKFFGIVRAALMMISIGILRSGGIRKTLPITPGAFEEVNGQSPDDRYKVWTILVQAALWPGGERQTVISR
jgi:hypothetical protein